MQTKWIETALFSTCDRSLAKRRAMCTSGVPMRAGDGGDEPRPTHLPLPLSPSLSLELAGLQMPRRRKPRSGRPAGLAPPPAAWRHFPSRAGWSESGAADRLGRRRGGGAEGGEPRRSGRRGRGGGRGGRRGPSARAAVNRLPAATSLSLPPPARASAPPALRRRLPRTPSDLFVLPPPLGAVLCLAG